MRVFTKVENKPTQTPISEMSICVSDIEQIRLGVYENTERPYVADVIVKMQDSTKLNLKNNLSKYQNVFYKVPAGYEDIQPWYDVAFERARSWGKYHNSNLHCKPGMRCNTGQGERYHTMPCTLFSYAPQTKTVLFQIATPGVKGNLINFNDAAEIEIDLSRTGKNNLCFDWTS